MDKRYFRLGLSIAFCLLLIFSVFLIKEYKQRSLKEKYLVAKIYKHPIYLWDLSNSNKLEELPLWEESKLVELLNKKIDSFLLTQEAGLIQSSVEDYLAFFDLAENIPVSKEEHAKYKETEKEILSKRKERSKEQLLKNLRQAYDIEMKWDNIKNLSK